MKKQLLAAAVFIGFSAGSSSAGDLSGVRCEDKDFIAFLAEELPTMKFEDGTPLFQYYDATNATNITATTEKATRDRLICRVGLKGVGAPTDYVKLVYREFPNGTASISIFPRN